MKSIYIRNLFNLPTFKEVTGIDTVYWYKTPTMEWTTKLIYNRGDSEITGGESP